MIEGMCAGPDGSLLIGLRSPLIDGRALIIPMRNPEQVIVGEPPEFGPPTQLDLGGRGIRSIENDARPRTAARRGYVICASPTAGADRASGDFGIFEWDGTGKPRRVLADGLTEMTPEAVMTAPDEDGFYVLSDDSHGPEGERGFRGFWLRPVPPR